MAIYDDPDANEQIGVTDHRTKEVEVAAEKDGAQLVVIEVHSLMVSADEQEAYVTVWAAHSADAKK